MKRFMKRMNEKKGFTLAELLIVVAIIAVLVAVAIPVFTAQLAKARESTVAANLRSAYASATVDVLDDNDLDTNSYTYGGAAYGVTYTAPDTISVSVTTSDGTYGYDGNTYTGFTKITPGS